jgi:hypothetical protein
MSVSRLVVGQRLSLLAYSADRRLPSQVSRSFATTEMTLMKNKSTPTKSKATPDTLVDKAKKKRDIELQEDDLKRVTGGMLNNKIKLQ